LAHWAYKNGMRTAYAVYQDYGPGIDAAAQFQKTFVGDGGKMLGEARIPVTNVDFSAYIQRIKDVKPDTVFVFLNNNGGAVPFLRGCEQAGVQKAGIKIVATGDLVDENYLPAIGDAALGLITAFHYSAIHPSPANKRFTADFNKVAGGQFVVDFGAVQAYDVMDAAYKVLTAQNGNIDPDKTMELVKGMKLDSPRGPMIIDPQTRDPIENVYLRRTEKRGGMLVNVEFETIPMVKDPNES
ncbi:MAG TPA: ABC transporter substrate-binding protein, partial [Candidatus Binatia bacterium]|nr:ABC transporter substrate-binding protein [Candidatus Binatia bacterium]